MEQELPLYERNSISSIVAGEKNGSRVQNFGIPRFFLSLFLLSHSPSQNWRPYNTSTNFHLVLLLRLYAKCRANKCNPPTPSLAEGSVDFNKCLFALDPAEARERDNNLRSWAILSISIIPTRVLHHKPRLIVRSNFLFVNKIKNKKNMRKQENLHTHTHRQVRPYLLTLTSGWGEGVRLGTNAEKRAMQTSHEPKQANKQTYKNHFPSHGKMSNVKRRGSWREGERLSHK